MSAHSAAVFSARLVELGLGDKAAVFKDKGWTTFSSFAFAANFQPGGADDSNFIKDVITPLVGTADHPLRATIRFLFFESFTIAVEELKRKSRVDDEDKPKKLPALERVERLDKVKRALVGLSIEGDLEPSYG
jgi:hypothetical protein